MKKQQQQQANIRTGKGTHHYMNDMFHRLSTSLPHFPMYF